MRRFASPGEFAAYLNGLADTLDAAADKALHTVGTAVRDEAKAMLGTYQNGWGPVTGWTPLAASTQRSRAAQGFTADNPLLRSGALRDSIGYGVEGIQAVVGSPLTVAAYMEQGTSRAPPRPVFGLVGARMSPYVASILSEAVVSHLAGMPVGSHPPSPQE